MSAVASAMPAFLRISLSGMMQYRGEIVLWAIWGVVYPAVAMAMWGAAIAGSPDGQSIHGFGPRDFAAYFLLTMIVGHVCTAWDIYEMGHLVRSGAMSPRLLRPIMPVWQSVADNIAYKLLTLMILVPIWLAVAWVAHPHFATGWVHLVIGVLAILIAAALHFIWQYNLALLAFWLTRMDGVSEIWWGMNLFFGGRLAFLTHMPIPLQWIAAVLPFKWIIWFPAATLMGQLDRRDMLIGLGWQLGWLVVGLIVFQLSWHRAVKRYSAVGA